MQSHTHGERHKGGRCQLINKRNDGLISSTAIFNCNESGAITLCDKLALAHHLNISRCRAGARQHLSHENSRSFSSLLYCCRRFFFFHRSRCYFTARPARFKRTDMNVLVTVLASGRVTEDHTRCSCTSKKTPRIQRSHTLIQLHSPHTSRAIAQARTPDRPVPKPVTDVLFQQSLHKATNASGCCCVPAKRVPVHFKVVLRCSAGPADSSAALAPKGATPLRKHLWHRAIE